jgi:dipeptidyl aminopeptidase/acylaminoacyl peptidase
MSAMGWSAGGHWSNWILVNMDCFKAIRPGGRRLQLPDSMRSRFAG